MCSVKYVSLHGLQKTGDIHAYINGYVILYTQSVQCVQLLNPSVKEYIIQLLSCWNFYIRVQRHWVTVNTICSGCSFVVKCGNTQKKKCPTPFFALTWYGHFQAHRVLLWRWGMDMQACWKTKQKIIMITNIWEITNKFQISNACTTIIPHFL